MARRTPATLQSVADAVGVSVRTVANTLRFPERVSAQTRERVAAEVRRQNYHPNTAGRSLRTNRSGLIGVCVSRPLSDGSVEGLVAPVTAAAELAGFHPLLFSERGPDVGAAYQDLLRRQAVDGFLLTGTEVDDPRHVWLQDRGVPFVSIGRRWTTELGPFVDFDGIAAMDQVVDHLVESGRSRIAFAGPAGDLGPVAERRLGVELALAERGLEPVEHEPLGPRRSGDGPPFDAVVAADDAIAVELLGAADGAGVTVGGRDDDIAVVGYGATAVATLRHRFTTVADPIGEAVRHAVELLAAMIADPNAAAEPVMLTPSLVPGVTS